MLNNSFDSLCGDYAANNDIIKDFANRCPQLKSQINETVCNLRKRILSCNPLHLLQFAQEHALFNKMGITSEFQQLDVASIAIDRFAEYVQSKKPKSTWRQYKTFIRCLLQWTTLENLLLKQKKSVF